MNIAEIRLQAAQILRQYNGRRRLAKRYKGQDPKRAEQNRLSAAQLIESLRELFGQVYRAVCAQYGKRPSPQSEKAFTLLAERYGITRALRRTVAKWGPAPSAESKAAAAKFQATPLKPSAKRLETKRRIAQYSKELRAEQREGSDGTQAVIDKVMKRAIEEPAHRQLPRVEELFAPIPDGEEKSQRKRKTTSVDRIAKANVRAELPKPPRSEEE